jgi:hypothetical protein
MTSEGKKGDGAQNQHYVPKFILRNFLSNESKEQVSVFRKSNGKGFVTSIRNIMAERRFHEFAIGEDYLASFETGICQIERQLLPTYRKVIEARRLDRSIEERANLAMLMAFQMVRTRQQREQFLRVEEQLKEHMEKHGGTIEQLDGYEPFTEERLTEQHIKFIGHSFGEFSNRIAAKDFLLLSAPEGRSFYLADNPVCLHNSEPADPFWGNIGLAVKGIEIYLPLAADLMLAAWCPSILQQIRDERDRQRQEQTSELLGMVMRGQISPDQMREQLAVFAEMGKFPQTVLAGFDAGAPVPMTESNMDFSNSLQMNYAREYVICKRGDLKLAQRFVTQFPDHTGKRPTAVI